MTTTVIVSPVDETPQTVVVSAPTQGTEVIVAPVGVQGPVGPVAPPAGANKQIQFNDNGVVAGSTPMIWDKTSNILSILGTEVAPTYIATRNGGIGAPYAAVMYGQNMSMMFANTYQVGWSATGNAVGGMDTVLVRDGAAGTLALRNGANSQLFNIYQSYIDASNYSRLKIGWTGSAFGLLTDQGGTGSVNALQVGTLGSNSVHLVTAGTNRFSVTNQGHMLPVLDNTYNIGSSASRVANLYVFNVNAYNNVSGTNAVFHASANAALLAGGVAAGVNGYIGWGASSNAVNGADTFMYRDGAANVVALRNGAQQQEFRLYSAYTDAANYSRLGLYKDPSYGWTFGTQAAGTGTQETIALRGMRLRILTGTGGVNTNIWRFESNGNLYPETTSAFDLGAASNTIRTIYTVTISATGNVTAGDLAAAYVKTTPRAVDSLAAPATAGAGARGFVNDSTLSAAGNFGAAVTGGGTNKVPVWTDGITWYIG